MNKEVKQSDIRFTKKSVFNKLKELTGINWMTAYDPTPKNSKTNTLDKSWNYSKIFMNPPFSKSSTFFPKMVDEFIKNKKTKKVLVILPWYQVEDIKSRVTSRPKWYSREIKRLKKVANIKTEHLGNQEFYNPIDKKMTNVRVYGIYLSR